MHELTETITFTREYNLQAGRLKQVDMREPNAFDIRNAMEASKRYQDDVDMRDIAKEQFLMVQLTTLSPDDINKLAACDYERLQIGLLILRADPDDRAKLRRDYALGGEKPSDSDPAMPEGESTSSEPDPVIPTSALP